MTLTEALLMAVIGMSLIGIVLIFLIFAMKVMSTVVCKITGHQAPEKKEEDFDTVADIVVPQQIEQKVVLAEGGCGELKLINTDDRDAALIMAIVANQMETPLNQLRFISIKQIKEVK